MTSTDRHIWDLVAMGGGNIGAEGNAPARSPGSMLMWTARSPRDVLMGSPEQHNEQAKPPPDPRSVLHMLEAIESPIVLHSRGRSRAQTPGAR